MSSAVQPFSSLQGSLPQESSSEQDYGRLSTQSAFLYLVPMLIERAIVIFVLDQGVQGTVDLGALTMGLAVDTAIFLGLLLRSRIAACATAFFAVGTMLQIAGSISYPPIGTEMVVMGVAAYYQTLAAIAAIRGTFGFRRLRKARKTASHTVAQTVMGRLATVSIMAACLALTHTLLPSFIG